MENKTLTKQQVQTIISGAPQGVTSEQVIQGLVTRGFQLEGLNDQKPQETQQPGFLDRLKQSVSDRGAQIAGGVEQGLAAPKSGFDGSTDSLGGAKGVANVVGGVAGLGSDLLGNVAQTADNALTGGKVLPAVGNAIAPIVQPVMNAVDKVAPEGTLGRDVLNATGNILNVAGGIEGAGLAKNLVTKGATSIQEGLQNLAKSSTQVSKEITDGLIKGTKGEEIASQILTKQVRLTPTQRSEFATMSGGLDEGQYLVQKGIYETNDRAIKALGEDWLKSYNEKKQALGQLGNQYTFNPANEALKELADYEAKTGVKGTKGLFTDKINQLLEASQTRGLTLNEIDDLKNIYERTVALGYGKEVNTIGVEKATRIDNALKTFIEKEGEKQGFTNIKELNKNTQLSRFLADAIENRVGSRAGNNFVSLSDSIMATGAVVDPRALALLAVKKTVGSEAVQAKLAKMIGGTVKKDIKANVEQSTPALLNSKNPTTPDFLVAPKGASTGQFESANKKIVTNGQKTNQVKPQEQSILNSPSSKSIPQSTEKASGKLIPKELQPLAEEARKYKSAEQIKNKYPNTEISIQENGDEITLSKIVVKNKGEGTGTKVMNDLIKYADETRKKILLTPSKDYGASSVSRLKDFYKRFGFIENKGKFKDFSTRETMYRLPK